MPDVSSAFDGSVFLIVRCDFDSVEDSFRGDDLVWPHDQQHVLGGEDAIFGQDV